MKESKLRITLARCGRIAQRHAGLLAKQVDGGGLLQGVCDVVESRRQDFGGPLLAAASVAEVAGVAASPLSE